MSGLVSVQGIVSSRAGPGRKKIFSIILNKSFTVIELVKMPVCTSVISWFKIER